AGEEKPIGLGQDDSSAEQRVVRGGEASRDDIGLLRRGAVEPIALALEWIGREIDSARGMGEEGLPIDGMTARMEGTERGEQCIELGAVLAKNRKEGARSVRGDAILGHRG